MPCGDVVAAEPVGPFGEHTEFEERVAHYAGVRCAAGSVFVDEIADNGLAESLALVCHIVGDAQTVGQGFRLGDEMRNVASRGKLAWQIPYAHRDTCHFVTGFLQHQAGGRTVGAARHADEYFLLSFIHGLQRYGKPRAEARERLLFRQLD